MMVPRLYRYINMLKPLGAVDKDEDAVNYYFPIITFVDMFILKDANVAVIGNCIFHDVIVIVCCL